MSLGREKTACVIIPPLFQLNWINGALDHLLVQAVDLLDDAWSCILSWINGTLHSLGCAEAVRIDPELPCYAGGKLGAILHI